MLPLEIELLTGVYRAAFPDNSAANAAASGGASRHWCSLGLRRV